MEAARNSLRAGRVAAAIIVLLLCCLARPATSAPQSSSTAEPPRVLVIHSSLLVPAYRAKLSRAAEGRVDLSFVSAGASARDAAQGQDLVLFDVPHESVTAEVFGDQVTAIRDVAGA